MCDWESNQGPLEEQEVLQTTERLSSPGQVLFDKGTEMILMRVRGSSTVDPRETEYHIWKRQNELYMEY